MGKTAMNALENELRGLPLEDIYSMYLEELPWQGCSEVDQARCAALDLKELGAAQQKLWRRVQKEVRLREPGGVIYQVSPDQGWSRDFLLLNRPGPSLLEDGYLDLGGGYLKVRGKMDPLMSAAYTGSRQTPGEEAVLRLLVSVCFASMRQAVLSQPLPMAVYGVIRDREGIVKLT